MVVDQARGIGPQANPGGLDPAPQHVCRTHRGPPKSRASVSSHGVGESVDRKTSHLPLHANLEGLRMILPAVWARLIKRCQSLCWILVDNPVWEIVGFIALKDSLSTLGANIFDAGTTTLLWL